MIPGKTYTPEDLLRLAWRRKWLIVLPFVLIGTATVVVSDRLPDRYRSETLILIVPQRIPAEYVRSTVTARIEDRLQSISQQILSRTRLEQIVEDLDLYQDDRETRLMEDIVETMRGDVQVDIIEGNAFRVSFEANDPRVAMLVTQQLASLFIDENLRDREVMARGTSAFLENQLQDARRRLVEHEDKLEAYKRRYSGELPSQLPANLQAIQSAQLQLQSVIDALNRDRDRLLLVQRSIRDLSPELGEGASPEAPAPIRLETARTALQDLEFRLTPEHPDLVTTKRLIEVLEKEVAAEASESPTIDAEVITRPDGPDPIRWTV